MKRLVNETCVLASRKVYYVSKRFLPKYFSILSKFEHMPSQRRCVLSALGVTLSGGLAGCFARDLEDEASLQVLSNLEEQTLEVEITGSEDEQLFSDTITVSEDEEITRENVVTGRDGDSFSVEVTKGDRTVSTSWQLSCVEDDDMRDLLTLIVTGRGEIHVSEACRAL